MEIPLDEVCCFDVTTRNPTTQAVSDADSAPTFDVFEESTDTPILDDQVMTKRTSLTGNYRGSFTLSAANGFEVGKWYSVIITAVVNSITDKFVRMIFRVKAAELNSGIPLVQLASGIAQAVVDDIKAKTDNLPSDPADASVIADSFSTVNSTLTTISQYVDTEVAAIKAKTDNLPSDPADASVIADAFSSIESLITTIDTVVDAIKVITDQLATTLELSGLNYRFTEAALAQAPSGGGGGTVPYESVLMSGMEDMYTTPVSADYFFENSGNPADWVGADDDDKVKALLYATKLIERLNYLGIKPLNQKLKFPREDQIEIPDDIQKACMHIALTLLDLNTGTIEQNFANLVNQSNATKNDAFNWPDRVRAGIPNDQCWNYIKHYLEAKFI